MVAVEDVKLYHLPIIRAAITDAGKIYGFDSQCLEVMFIWLCYHVSKLTLLSETVSTLMQEFTDSFLINDFGGTGQVDSSTRDVRDRSKYGPRIQRFEEAMKVSRIPSMSRDVLDETR